MGPRDRISNLPDNLIHEIMERLPLRDAARMSILSKKWRGNWRTLPALVLDRNFFNSTLGLKRYSNFHFSCIVSKILLQHNGPITKFSLHIPHDVGPDITQWILFLSMNCIMEFTLSNRKYMPTLHLPSHLFSCANLTKLKLVCFYFNPPPSFKGFPNLLSLDLENIRFLNDRIFGDFVAKCPHLEKLSLREKKGGFELPRLAINAPNLKYLTISGIFQSIYLHGSQALLSVSITLQKLGEHQVKNKAQELIQFLASSCKVEKISFSSYFVKFLVEGGVSGMLPVPFNHVRNLRLASIKSCEELSCAIGIIQNCPNVEGLHLSVNIAKKSTDAVEHDLICDFSFKCLRLQSIKMRLNWGSDLELKVIELLLLCSPLLETFDINICQELNASAKSKISKKLKQLHKEFSSHIFLISMSGKGNDETSDSDINEDLDSTSSYSEPVHSEASSSEHEDSE